MAGHDDSTFRKFYNQAAIQTTQISIMALQEKMDTITAVEALGLDDSDIGEDRVRRIEALREKARKEKEKKIRLKKEGKSPMPRKSALKIIEVLLKEKFDCFDKIGAFWVEDILMWLHEYDVVGCMVANILDENRLQIVNFVRNLCMVKVKKGKSLYFKDRDAGYQIFNWILQTIDEMLVLGEQVLNETDYELTKLLCFKRFIKSEPVLSSLKASMTASTFSKLCVDNGISKDELDYLCNAASRLGAKDWFFTIDYVIDVVVLNPLHI